MEKHITPKYCCFVWWCFICLECGVWWCVRGDVYVVVMFLCVSNVVVCMWWPCLFWNCSTACLVAYFLWPFVNSRCNSRNCRGYVWWKGWPTTSNRPRRGESHLAQGPRIHRVSNLRHWENRRGKSNRHSFPSERGRGRCVHSAR